MKKIFLLFTLTAMLVCLFAISASAAAPDSTKESVTLDDGTVCPIWDTDGDALIWYKSTANTDDGYAAYDYVKAQDPSINYYADGNYTAAGGSSFNEVTSVKINDTNLKDVAVVVNFMDPDIKITSGKRKGEAFNGFKDILSWARNLEYAYLPTSLVAAMKNAMCGCPKLKYVNFEDLVNLEEIGQEGFAYNPMLFANGTLDLSHTKIAEIETGGLAGSSSKLAERTNYKVLILPSTLKNLGNYPFQYNNELTTVIGLESTSIKKITDSCFTTCPKLSSVALPSTLTTIDQKVFYNCGSLTTVTLPAGVTSIGNSAFYGCSRLTAVVGLENTSVKKINYDCFSGCSQLSNVVLPSTLKEIDQKAFYKCISLTTANIPEGVTFIGASAYDGCTSLATVTLPSTLLTMKDRIFQNTAITSIVVPNSVTSFGTDMFNNCQSLKTATLPSGLTKIPLYTFYKCTALESFYMSDNVTEIGQYAFCSCTSLGPVYLSKNIVTIYCNGTGKQGAFQNCTNMYFVNNPGETQKPDIYYFPETLKTIGAAAFKNCLHLNTTLVFPQNAVNVDDDGWNFGNKNQSTTRNIVFLGKVESLIFANENYNTNFYYVHPDVTAENLTISFANNGTQIPTNCYVYLCASGKRAKLEKNYTWTEDGYAHLNNPMAQGNRVVSGATCTENEKIVDICFCGKAFNEHYVEGTALGHDNVILSLKYENGFTVNGLKSVCCVRDNCEYENEEAASAIFTGFLYATREEDDGICGLVFTYEINNEALALYESINNTQVVFGALSVAEHNLSSTSPIGVDGKANQDKVIRAQLSGMEVSINHVDYIIRGSADAWNAVFNAETGATVKDVKFYILGYTVESGSVNYFLGENTSNNIKNLATITYNTATNK